MSVQLDRMIDGDVEVAKALSPIKQIIKSASRSAGVDFRYMVNTAERESSLNPRLGARTSSAKGLYQFTKSTWAETLKAHGMKYNLPSDADPMDPVANALMGAEFLKDNMAYFERQRAEIEAVNLKRRDEAAAVAAKMDGVRVVLIRQASEGGHLYGSVAARDIQEALREAGYKVERRQVVLNTPLKSLGSYTVPVSLHPEVSVDVAVVIARSAAEAEEQQKTASEEQVVPAEEIFEDSVLEEGEETEA